MSPECDTWNQETAGDVPISEGHAINGLVFAVSKDGLRNGTVGLDMRYQSGTSARQLTLEYRNESRGDSSRAQEVAPAVARGSSVCAICQTRQVMVHQRRAGRTELFHTLCFRCYHEQMQRKRMAKRRRSVAVVRAAATAEPGVDTQAVGSRDPKYRDLDHRRHQAQIAARRQLAKAGGEPCQDQPTELATVAAVLAGRV